MNTTNYKNCLSATGLLTGNLLASYNFSNQVGSVILNDLYPTGDCYFNDGFNNVFYASKNNLGILQNGSAFTSSFTGYFSGSQYGIVQSEESFKNFDVLLDFSLDNCSSTYSRVLLSTVTGTSLSSGLVFGVNQANKFFIEYGAGTDKRIHTSKLGISESNVVNFGINNEVFYLRKYDFLNSSILDESFSLYAFPYSNRLIFAKSFGVYSGFSGKVNHAFISSNSSNGLNGSCYECAFCSGVVTSTVTGEQEFFLIEDPLSYYNYSISGTGVTGYGNHTTYDSLTDTYVSNLSGVTGSFLLNSFVTGDEVLSTGFFETVNTNVFLNKERRSEYINSIKVNFISTLESGDLLEVYDYNNKNSNIGLRNNAVFNSNLAVFSNGMLLISGLDYGVGGGLVTGYFDGSDEIIINKINNPIKYLLYSGLYDSYKKLTGEGVNYYPPQSQFYESGDGNITITGLEGLFYSGFSLTGHDLFMNGQKIYTGIDYETGAYGGKESVIINAANFNDADLAVTTGVSGVLISIDYQTESVLSFCPKQEEPFSSRVLFLNSSLSYYNLSGKSEEIWLNGIKLIEDVDYGKVYPCSSYSYNFNIKDLPYIFCKNNDNFFNIS